MTNLNFDPRDLLDCIDSSCGYFISISCFECGIRESRIWDEPEFFDATLEELVDKVSTDGWIAFQDHAYCPKCISSLFIQ